MEIDGHSIQEVRWHKMEEIRQEAVDLIEKEGGLSSDAMILNMSRSSKSYAILSGDADIGIVVSSFGRHDKICILPDSVANAVSIFCALLQSRFENDTRKFL